jgi:hypothetical protein
VSHIVKQERNILHAVKIRKGNWIGHILCRDCLLKHVIEGKIEGRIVVTERQGTKRKQLRNGRKATRKSWKLKQEATDPLCGERAMEQTMDLPQGRQRNELK